MSVEGTTRTAAHPVPETDPVGAGDSFVAGCLAARLSGQDTTDCLALAARVAAWPVATDGDWEGLPAPTEPALDEAPPGTVTQ
ncbi:PfkB family carbohydrate kinase [Streptomyces eurythermus]|uniref:PfkB family carbohydrate kinase n=1 Tax=Streptomyces eurythermus TaxID=42237 RepID=UPI0036FBBBC9